MGCFRLSLIILLHYPILQTIPRTLLPAPPGINTAIGRFFSWRIRPVLAEDEMRCESRAKRVDHLIIEGLCAQRKLKYEIRRNLSVDIFSIGNVFEPSKQDMEVDTETKRQVLDALSKDLVDYYVFPDVAKQIASKLQSNRSDYLSITSAQEFAEALTKGVQSINDDRHLRVIFSPQKIPVRHDRAKPTEEEIRHQHAEMADQNYGFGSVKRLDGNIGYIELRKFMDHELGEDTVAAAMNFIHNTDALIIDLRQNSGGSPKMVALISSYFFADQKVHLNSIYWRKDDTTNKFYTHEKVKGKKYGDKDLYILTGNRTGSAAEGFSYHLRNLKRATIIGETTVGAAHPGDRFRLHEHFSAFIATGRAINPITKTNWEGVGVKPHIPTSKEDALDTAIVTALEKKLATTADQDSKDSMERLIVRTKMRLGKAEGG